MKYDQKEQMIFERYRNYKIRDGHEICNRREKYIYDDTLLIRTFSRGGFERSKTFKTYNEKGQVIKFELYEFNWKYREDVPHRGVVGLADYEWRRTWELMWDCTFEYDRRGNKVLYEIKKVRRNECDRYTWTYDEKNRVVESREYFTIPNFPDHLLWTEEYNYSEGGYQMLQTKYDHECNPRHLKTLNYEYSPRVIAKVKTNSSGQILEKTVMEENGKIYYRETTEYNSDGLIWKTKRYDSNNILEMTHFYKYSYRKP